MKPRCKKPGFRNGVIMADTKRCVICNKQKPSNEFTKTDTIQVCVACKKIAIEDAKRNK